jgi:mycoredoxin
MVLADQSPIRDHVALNDSPGATMSADTPTITVYWRPGCGFCSRLRRQLDAANIGYREVDIWSDPDGAAFVRSVANGNETVPTVAIGTVALVNPPVDAIIDVARGEAPATVAHIAS